jgi:aspartate racemase
VKTLGLLGGLSWVSTVDYYRRINEGVNARLGGLDFARCVVYSLNFGDLQRRGWDDWEHTRRLVGDGAVALQAAGADAIVLCAMTAHAVADEVATRTGLPVVHAVAATAEAIARRGLRRVGLLGTRFTMELPFFRDALHARGIEALTPDENERGYMQATLRDELGKGIVSPATKAAYLAIIDALVARGAGAIVFACTELPLLLSQDDVSVPVFDTLELHCEAAVDFALAGHDATNTA